MIRTFHVFLDIDGDGVNDEEGHTRSPECVCGPEENVQSNGWIVWIHGPLP